MNRCFIKHCVLFLSLSGLFSTASDHHSDCKPEFGQNLAPHLVQQQANEQLLSFDCGQRKGCDAYFDIAMEAGSEVFLNLCGSTSWPTSISVWSGPDFQNHETCRTPGCTAIFVAPRNGVYRFRIAGLDQSSGTASLTVETSAKTLIIGAPAPVPTLGEYGLLALILGLGIAALKLRR